MVLRADAAPWHVMVSSRLCKSAHAWTVSFIQTMLKCAIQPVPSELYRHRQVRSLCTSDAMPAVYEGAEPASLQCSTASAFLKNLCSCRTCCGVLLACCLQLGKCIRRHTPVLYSRGGHGACLHACSHDTMVHVGCARGLCYAANGSFLQTCIAGRILRFSQLQPPEAGAHNQNKQCRTSSLCTVRLRNSGRLPEATAGGNRATTYQHPTHFLPTNAHHRPFLCRPNTGRRTQQQRLDTPDRSRTSLPTSSTLPATSNT